MKDKPYAKFSSDEKATVISLALEDFNVPCQLSEKANHVSECNLSSASNEVQVRIGTRSTFDSNLGLVISCLGSAVGTGNIWRFPRILASNSSSKGSLAFYIAWIILLFCWSIPVILLEYVLGRFTRNSVPVAFTKFLGKYSVWIGGWLVTSVFFLSCYYPVIIGWCFYYLYKSIALKELPTTEEAGEAIFNEFTGNSYLPVIVQIVAVLVTGVFLFGGIRWIERANMILVPLLLCIVIFTFGWSLTREYAEVGIAFLLTPSWNSLADSSLWIAAASQNAFDTGAGMALLMTYAIYVSRDAQIVKYSMFIPITNNLVSIYASFTLFSTVFSTMVMDNPTLTRSAIVKIIQTTGPGSTGLTFTWIPVLFSKVGIFGRVLCSLFFLCLSFAGISSLIAEVQVYIVTIKDFGVSHKIAVAISVAGCVCVGVPSAISLQFLENQDNTWGYALIISGLLLTLIPIFYGPLRFRRIVVNIPESTDWRVPLFWVPIIAFLVPLQTITLIGWWIYNSITTDENWYRLTFTSVTSTLVEWSILIVVLLVANLVAVRVRGDRLFEKARQYGSDPYDPSTYERNTDADLVGPE
ncbi:Sodium dependent neurotransmitter transporter [Fasciolopsis buskii]|uniref:Sodium dependent neurotransmitter transporter n=1 Tax=Fasciolopsis buskii TaxID=27845 RepID=A0A8E0RMW5_9TREM|nr:Sodium dependent neurotransmitter transporter [Fasciolopsis buski]